MIRTRATEWFECKIRYEKTMENGMRKKVTEAYTVDALSFTEAEQRIMEEMQAYISGEFVVVDISRAAYKEIFFSDRDSADKWYKCKLSFITIDEKTQSEKRANVYYLVQAGTIDEAKANIDEVMSTTMIDYEVLSVAETKLMDVFEYKSKESSEKVVKAVKKMQDSIPEGTKVTMRHTDTNGTVHETVVGDKTDGSKDRKEIPKDE